MAAEDITWPASGDATRIPPKAVKAFGEHRRRAKHRGIPFLFTLTEWWAWWQIDGRWGRRGKHRGGLVMARHSDAGPYHPDNVRAATPAENQADITPEKWAAAVAKARETRIRNGTANHSEIFFAARAARAPRTQQND